jgi:hypothetical protein
MHPQHILRFRIAFFVIVARSIVENCAKYLVAVSKLAKDEEPGCQLQLLSHANASSSAFAFFRSAVLKPSVNPA